MSPSRLILFLFLPFNFIGFCHAQSDSLKKKSYEFARQGLELVDKKHLDEAIVAFEKGFALDPENSNFQYEIALVHYLKKEYAQTISILEKYKDKPDANDQYYQILGNAYDLTKQTIKARKTYAAGIKRFPKSGPLLLESGILEYMQKNIPDALRYWEAGVIAQPDFPGNYYWLAKTYATSTESIWAVLYGEIFLNLDRHSEKTEEISKLLCELYKKCLPHTPGVPPINSFTKSLVTDTAQGVKLPFEQVFQETMQKAADSVFRQGADSIGPDELCKVRELFLFYWYSNEPAGIYTNIIFNWHKKLLDSGYFESYNRWIFLKGNEDAFQSWYYANPEKYGTFTKWFGRNPLKITKDSYFSRSLY
jgi:tetratricopeptide (TPR) repeat protein